MTTKRHFRVGKLNTAQDVVAETSGSMLVAPLFRGTKR
jgi:hypothetical protein